MTEIPQQCYADKDHIGGTLVCEEKGRRVVFLKPKGKAADKIRVDGCVLKKQKACDYLVRDWKDRHHFVELKGGDDEYALQQIAETIPHFIKRYSDEEFWCLIACTGCSPAIRPGLQAAKRRISKIWRNANIIIRTNECEYRMPD